MKKNISQEILEKIKEKKISPKPKWQFLFKDYFIWTIAGIFLIIGSLSAAVIIYMINNNDWDLYQQASNSLLGFIFATLPYLWIISLIVFIFIADYNFKQTKTGYRYQISKVILFSILLSLVLGFFFYNFGLAKTIEHIFEDVPFYKKVMEPRHRVWMQTEKGLISGQIVSVQNENKFILKDLNGKIWEISCCRDVSFKERLKEGMRIRIFGQSKEGNIFEAFKVMPLIGKQWMVKGMILEGLNERKIPRQSY